MDVKTSRTTYPKSVLSLYLRLFCKRRNSDKNKMLEGIQSWLTLSKSEKQQFFNKYKECRLMHKVKVADYLTKVQPFLKKRNIKRTLNNMQLSKEEAESKQELNEQNVNEMEERNYHVEKEQDIRDNDEINSSNDQYPLETGQPNYSKEEPSKPQLAEPAPPSVRNGRELFEMLKATTDGINNESWASLSRLQKNRYQRAIQLLKNDYIKKYKAYLESLPSKDLFNYYIDYFD